jgi:hypothetical protein
MKPGQKKESRQVPHRTALSRSLGTGRKPRCVPPSSYGTFSNVKLIRLKSCVPDTTASI